MKIRTMFGSYPDEPKLGWGQITAVFDEDGLLRFERTKRDEG